MLKELENIKSKLLLDIKKIKSQKELEDIKIAYLGKNSSLMKILSSIGKASKEERKILGQTANLVKNALREIIQNKSTELEGKELLDKDDSFVDLTKPLWKKRLGTLHPITLVTNEIVDIFSSMGFMILDGPMMEDDYHNFEALNIPQNHPARDMQDTFWLKNGSLLRTHTSSVQIRAMEKYKPPFKGIAPGRVFRYEALDASHENTFYQCEGLLIDKNISVSHLFYF